MKEKVYEIDLTRDELEIIYILTISLSSPGDAIKEFENYCQYNNKSIDEIWPKASGRLIEKIRDIVQITSIKNP